MVYESLKVNGKEIFTREGQELRLFVSIRGLPPAKKDMETDQGDLFSEALTTSFLKVLSSGLRPTDLFLSNGFKTTVDSELSSKIIRWFVSKLDILYYSPSLRLISDGKNEAETETCKVVAEVASELGSRSEGFDFGKKSEDKNNAGLFSVFTDGSGRKFHIRSEIFESFGTYRFMNFFPIILNSLRTGSALFIDEFDASIHPVVIMNLINIFHNDEINTTGAQLIFNTHNPIFLNGNLFRRDEIKFIEFDGQENTSVIYSLADFGTNGKNGVRKTDDYLKNYFVNRYGAINFVDFSGLVEKVLKGSDEK